MNIRNEAFVALTEKPAPGVQPETQDKELTLLDILVVLAEQSRLLVIGPIVVGLIVYGFTLFLPNLYTSVAYLALNEAALKDADVLMRLPAVLNSVLKSHNEWGGDLEGRRRALEQKFRWSLVRGANRQTAKLSVLEVDSNSPEDAQSLNVALIDAWFEASKPRPETRALLERNLQHHENELTSISNLLSSLEEKAASTLVLPGFNNERAFSISSLLERRMAIVSKTEEIRQLLQGKSRDLIQEPPSLPVARTWPNRIRLALVGAVASGILLLLFVIARHALLRASAEPEGAEKLARIKKGLRSWISFQR